MEREVARRTEEVVAIQDVTILAMASLAETRDTETGNHIRRTQFYVRALAEKLKEHPRFAGTLTDGFIGMLLSPLRCTTSARSGFRTISCSSPAASSRTSSRS